MASPLVTPPQTPVLPLQPPEAGHHTVDRTVDEGAARLDERDDEEFEPDDDPVARDLAGGVLAGRYRIEAVLGRGGMADVYLAQDDLLGRRVAVKVFRPSGHGDAARARERFRTEMATLAALSHAGLVPLYDGDHATNRPWCVMQFVDGGTLADLAEPLDPPTVAAIGAGLCEALSYIHALGIVHRDVKPSNVLIARDGCTYLSDFGVAQLVDATRVTATGDLVGTAAYLAPEQVLGHRVTSAVDVYSLGLVLLEALTGHREYPGAPVESAVARLSRAPHLPPWLGPDWGALLAAMTASRPEDRPEAAEAAGYLVVLAEERAEERADAPVGAQPGPAVPTAFVSVVRSAAVHEAVTPAEGIPLPPTMSTPTTGTPTTGTPTTGTRRPGRRRRAAALASGLCVAAALGGLALVANGLPGEENVATTLSPSPRSGNSGRVVDPTKVFVGDAPAAGGSRGAGIAPQPVSGQAVPGVLTTAGTVVPPGRPQSTQDPRPPTRSGRASDPSRSPLVSPPTSAPGSPTEPSAGPPSGSSAPPSSLPPTSPAAAPTATPGSPYGPPA